MSTLNIQKATPMTPLLQPSPWLRGASVLAVLLGLMTLKEGGTVLFGDEAALTAAGAYVLFVLWFNFLAGFAYVVAGIALSRRQGWAGGLALGIALATALVFAAFGVYVMNGGAFEVRTMVAVVLRITVWLAIGTLAWRIQPGRTG